uniref:Uncharacterized protein n=1 Tax=Trichobilharzia regenti TaxID=157069 RepID=A0AA85KAI0_TRIRE|nr:unnamed protein product [Trichobilharzia regenti]
MITFTTTDEIEYYDDYSDELTTIKPTQQPKKVKPVVKKTQNEINPLMKKTIQYREKSPSGSNDEYYDDEIIETTWVVKLGNKNVTDKDLLNYINKETNIEELFRNSLKDNSNNSDYKYDSETLTSLFTVPKTVKLSNKTIDQFLDKDTDLDGMLKTYFPMEKTTKRPIEVISKTFWFSKDFDDQIENLGITKVLKSSKDFKKILNDHSNSSSSTESYTYDSEGEVIEE